MCRQATSAAGDISFWQAAVRNQADDLYEPLRDSIVNGTPMSLDILYGDHEGGQRAITRFFLTPRSRATDEDSWQWMCSTSRHWKLDRADPR